MTHYGYTVLYPKIPINNRKNDHSHSLLEQQALHFRASRVQLRLAGASLGTLRDPWKDSTTQFL